jgi:hypothetical protein
LAAALQLNENSKDRIYTHSVLLVPVTKPWEERYLQYMKAKNILRTLSKIINHIKTHEEGFIVPWASTNKRIEARNQLARLANLIGRRGSGIKGSGAMWEGGQIHWGDFIGHDNKPGIARVDAVADKYEGTIKVTITATDALHEFIKENGHAHIRHGKVSSSPSGTEIIYEGETPEEIIEKMQRDGFIIPRDETLTQANRKKIRRQDEELEAVKQRLLDEGIITEQDAENTLWIYISDKQLREAWHDAKKWDELVMQVRAKLAKRGKVIG